ncbi:MAG TPA: biotin--[acetyl-CoA-carboxylase] ligase [Trebonia sp.]
MAPAMMDEGVLRAAALGGFWTALDVVASTGSTNVDLLARAVADPALPEGQVLVAEEQTAGRGRLGRTWTSVPGASLTFSVLLRPATVPAARRGLLALLTGVAVASAVRSVTGGDGSGGDGSGSGVDAVLKWPNDVLAGDRKLAGILAEQSPDGSAVVIGTGINVATPAEALPVSPTGLAGTSLLAEGATVAREALLLEVLRQLERWYVAFRADPDPVRTGLLDAYRPLCVTLGQKVRVELPIGRFMTGVARDIDPDGRLLISDNPGDPPMAISAGDVVHVRPSDGPTMSLWVKTARLRWARCPSRCCIRTGRRSRCRSCSRSSSSPSCWSARCSSRRARRRGSSGSCSPWSPSCCSCGGSCFRS